MVMLAVGILGESVGCCRMTDPVCSTVWPPDHLDHVGGQGGQHHHCIRIIGRSVGLRRSLNYHPAWVRIGALETGFRWAVSGRVARLVLPCTPQPMVHAVLNHWKTSAFSVLARGAFISDIGTDRLVVSTCSRRTWKWIRSQLRAMVEPWLDHNTNSASGISARFSLARPSGTDRWAGSECVGWAGRLSPTSSPIEPRTVASGPTRLVSMDRHECRRRHGRKPGASLARWWRVPIRLATR